MSTENTQPNESDDEVLVYDAQNDEHVTMHKVNVSDEDKSFLQCLYDADDFLSTSEIKSRTGLGRRQINYRYKKFGEDRYTEIIEVGRVDPKDLPRNLEKILKKF